MAICVLVHYEGLLVLLRGMPALYSTVGYGDIAPVGSVRLLAGTEALVGLVFITWSASFTYLEMQRDGTRE